MTGERIALPARVIVCVTEAIVVLLRQTGLTFGAACFQEIGLRQAKFAVMPKLSPENAATAEDAQTARNVQAANAGLPKPYAVTANVK